MIAKKSLKNRLKSAIFGVFFAILSIFGFTTISAFVNPPTDVYAEPADTDSSSDTIKNLLTPGSNPPTTNSQNTENTTANPSGNPSDASADGASTDSSNQTANPQTTDNCYSQVGALGWFICPGVGVLSKAIDSIYSQIEVLLQVNPVSIEGDSPLFYVWQIMRDITNILFVIALLIVIYSQVTGIGITNYGIKKALPKLIIAAVLVNLSFILCALAVDASNIIGSGLRGIFDNIQTQAINSGGLSSASTITWTDLATALISGGVVAGFVISASSLLFPILGAVLCAIISVLVGLITLGLRQSLVSVLIMISPVAFICYLLPNTEKWFSKWREIFISMLIFYPLFSLLFGASRLAGWTLITTSIANDNAFGVAIGMVVQVLPLVLSISLMKMSGTILGKVSSGLDKLADIPRGGIRDTAKRYRQFAHDNRINTSASPSAHLQRFLDRRKRGLELDTENAAKERFNRADYWARRHSSSGIQDYDPAYDDDYKRNGIDKDGNKTKHKLRTTRSARIAKRALTSQMAAENAARDASHILSGYGEFHNRTKQDTILGKKAGDTFFEMDRTLHTEENDSFADQDWLMMKTDSVRKEGEDSYNYKHYISGGAGSLGRAGENNVFGQVIAKSAQNEMKQKNYTDLTLHKWGYGSHNKSAFRDAVTGFAIDDNGFAVDKVTRKRLSSYTDPKTGKTIKIKERVPLEFLLYHPEYLEQCAYTLKDENGDRYFNLEDKDGNFISRIYTKQGPAIKAIMQNWDMPINDPINNVYSTLAGIKPGTFAKDYPLLDGVGLSNFSTTIEKGLISSKFKEKSAHSTQFFAKLAGQSYIGDMNQLNIARLDSLIKTATASSYNLQDAAEFEIQKQLFNPDNWDWMLFNDSSIRGRLGIDGQELSGTRYKLDANGNFIKNTDGSFAWEEIPANSKNLTHQDLVNSIIRKYLVPAGDKLPSLMAKITPNILDKQKAGIPDLMDDVLDAFESWTTEENLAKYPGLNNPKTKMQIINIDKARKAIRRNNIISKDINLSDDNSPVEFEPGQRIELSQHGESDPTPSQTGGGVSGPKSSDGSSSSSEMVAASPGLQYRKQSASNRANRAGYGVNNKLISHTAKDYLTQYGDYDSRRHQTLLTDYDNLSIDLESLADYYSDDPSSFIYEAEELLEKNVDNDDRIIPVINAFADYVRDHIDDGITTTEEYCEYLTQQIALSTYQN